MLVLVGLVVFLSATTITVQKTFEGKCACLSTRYYQGKSHIISHCCIMLYKRIFRFVGETL